MTSGVRRAVISLWVLAVTPTSALVARALPLPARPVPSAPHEPRCVPSSEPLDEGAIALNTGLVLGVKGFIDAAYAGRASPYARFYVLETVARVPYFAYLSCLHLYESLGLRSEARKMRVHYAEADNELHHLLIMESLGGSDAFVDRFLAQHLAFGYYWFVVAVYLCNPRAAYHLSELIEEHAFQTYDRFLVSHEEELRARPVPEVAREYYAQPDAMREYLDAQSGRTEARRPLDSLYDVICCVRDDEAAHWETLASLVQYETLEAPDGCELEPLEPGEAEGGEPSTA